MIIVRGSVDGLPEFVKILQMCVMGNTLIFICRKLATWNKEHYRTLEIQTSSGTEIMLAELSELIDDYPLIDNKCRTYQMVTFKRYIHTYVW